MPLRLTLLTIFLALPLVAAQQAPQEEVSVKMTFAGKTACKKALAWLAARQNADGSWSESRYPHNTAITAFALLAFMSQGHLPGQGEYGPVVAKGAKFLIASPRAEGDGYLVGRGGNMYCHGMAALALAELYGMTNDDDLKPVLERAVDLIVRCQSPQGGWRYDPNPHDADISATIMQVMALRAAKNGGLNVPDVVMQRALQYVEACRDPGSGGFNYQPGQRHPGFARTAAGACILQLCGKYDHEMVPKAIEYLQKDVTRERRFRAREYFWYGHYYAAHAMHCVGGEKWKKWYGDISNVLLPRQSDNGAWETQDLEGNPPGPVYQTSIAVIILSTPLSYLPIYQR
jgi:hypothetical protein